jgi:hypothetical protein
MKRLTPPSPLRSLFAYRGAVAIATLMVIAAGPASAAEASYRYIRFRTTKLIGNGVNVMLSEFTFSRGESLLNLNNRDGTGVDIVPVSVTAGGIIPDSAEGPMKLVDGQTSTKLFRSAGTEPGNEIVFDFTTPVTVDSYNFATASDSASYIRLPVSWRLEGSSDNQNWVLLDARNDVEGNNSNETYQAGFDLPDEVGALINEFKIRNTATEGTAGIVLNGESVTLDYDVTASTSRMILQGPDATQLPTEKGSLVVTPPANSGAAPYTLVALGTPTAVQTLQVRSVIGGSATYKYVRYTITGRSGGGGGLVQVSEIEFYHGSAANPANKQTILSATNPGGRNGLEADEGANKLFDGNPTTKWLDDNPNVPVIFYFGETPVTFDRYLFVTGNDAVDRDPVQWTLEGSNDEETWDLIENVNFQYPTPSARNLSSRSIPLPGASLEVALKFSGNVAKVVQGDSMTLSYEMMGAVSATDTLTLTASTSEVLPAIVGFRGAVDVHPQEDTTYTLTATRAGTGVIGTAEVKVVVVPDPGGDGIAFDDFSEAAAGINAVGSTFITGPSNELPNRLRLTPDAGGLRGAAWHLKKFATAGGFEATFGLHMNALPNATHPPADGISFVIQNSPAGNGELGNGEFGVAQNALNICFRSFGYSADPASLIEVRSGAMVVARCVAYNQPGVVLHGMPGVPDGNGVIQGAYPYSMGSLPSDPAYRIRVVYKPGDLDVYLDGIAVIQNVEVNLGDEGAADAAGKSYFGFTARTGAYSQNNDITDWHLKFGDFSALPPFGIVKTVFKSSRNDGVLDTLDIVWNASESKHYRLLRTLDLRQPRNEWEVVVDSEGVAGQIGLKLNYEAVFDPAEKAFFSVSEGQQ